MRVTRPEQGRQCRCLQARYNELGTYHLHLDVPALRTLAFVTLVFGSQATIYAIRERQHLWSSRPSSWLVASSVVDVALASTLVVTGVAMAHLPVSLAGEMIGASIAFCLALDSIRLGITSRLGLVDARPATPHWSSALPEASSRRPPV